MSYSEGARALEWRPAGTEPGQVHARLAQAAEDRGLIELAQGRDEAALRQLIARHERRALTVAFGLVHDENDAREIVQEAFLRVHRHLATFHGRSTFFTWFYRIVTNLAIDLMRKPTRRITDSLERWELDETAELPLAEPLEGSDPLAAVRRREIAESVHACLARLPPYHRGVIVMREIEGLSYEEMAERMGVSKGTIMSRLFHARQKLQLALADCYEEQVGALPRRP